jgi:Fe-S oxidoreductase
MEQITKDTIEKGLAALKEFDNGRFLTSINSCVHCGLCGESCIYYAAMQENSFIPAKKVELISSIYKRYNTFIGRTFPKATHAKELDSRTIAECVDLFYGACTLCGRCTMHCSIGVDIAYLVSAGRTMLAEMGVTPETLQSTVNAALTSGNNMSIATDEFVDTLEWLGEELRDEVNDPHASIPLNEKDREILYTLNPREPKFFPLSISAMAKIFYAAQESWTLSTHMYDVTNYAYFSGNEREAGIIARRMLDEVKKLNAKQLILAECGHGNRVLRWEAPNYLKTHFDFPVRTSVELLAEYIASGRIRVDKIMRNETVTLHDPCHLVRNGGVIDEQRYILSKIVDNFVEMNPHGVDNLCCGGGGGQLSMSEYNERRMKIGALKAHQIMKTGASVVVTPCHNCVDQLLQLNAFYKLNIKIKTLAEVVADALIV